MESKSHITSPTYQTLVFMNLFLQKRGMGGIIGVEKLSVAGVRG